MHMANLGKLAKLAIRIRAMEEGVKNRVCCGVSDFAGGENKEYGWEVALQEDVRGRGGRCRAVRVRAL